ncbi:DUF4158 domain-containing protein [Streptomyces sioyaensis]|uniref:DUF4158 domain-containing protein n=1 Tax=Streptomyces sioyaensis TaxID=67364 RepID=UPI0036E52305
MASVERTAYPRFKRIISERELAQFFTPDEAEVAWAAKRTHERPERLITLLVLLKCCARLGYFPDLADIPEPVVERIRETITVPLGAPVGFPADRSAERYRSWVRAHLGLVHDPARARAIAMAAMEEAAPVRASVVDLVNVALEELVREGLELPAFSTLDRMAASVRTRVEGEICARIAVRVGSARERLAELLVVPDGERRSPFDVVKEPGRRATWSRFRQHGERVDLVDGFGDAGSWVEGVAAARVSAFSEQARVLSVGEMLDISQPRRTALLACTVAKARARVRDEFVVMLSKRMTRHGKRAQEELMALERRHKASTEQLLVAYKDVLTVLKEHVVDERADRTGQDSLEDALAVKRIRKVVETGGGFDAQLAEIEALAAYRGGNWTPLVERFFRPDRPTMFKLAQTLTFVPTSRDRSVLDALEHALAHRHLTRELISDVIVDSPVATGAGDRAEPRALDLSFASVQWRATGIRRTGRGCWYAGTSRPWSSPTSSRSSAAGTSPWPVRRTSVTGRRCSSRGSEWSRRYRCSASKLASPRLPTASLIT